VKRAEAAEAWALARRGAQSSLSSSLRCRCNISTTISDTLGRVFFPSPSVPLIRRMLRRRAAVRRAFNSSAGMWIVDVVITTVSPGGALTCRLASVAAWPALARGRAVALRIIGRLVMRISPNWPRGIA
jgi:hypothetical protein